MFLLLFKGIACGPRVPLYLFFKKDAAAPVNAAMAVNKIRRSRLWLHRSPHLPPAQQEPAASGLPRCPYAALTGQPVRPYYGRHLFSRYKPACILS